MERAAHCAGAENFPVNRLGSLVAAALAVGACLTSCAASPYGEGWKLGYVDEIIPGSRIDDVASHPCIADTPTAELTTQNFVVVTYRSGRRWRYRTLPMPAFFTPKQGERVWINVVNCAEPLRPADPSQ